ncbi:MAG: hypothetical protein WCL51_15970 [Bacteroidota bacterium]
MNSTKKLLFVLLLSLLVFNACKTTSVGNDPKKKTSQKTKNKPNQMSNMKRLEIDGLFIDAEKERLLGNLTDALNIYSKIINKEPENAAAYYQMSRIYEIQKKNTEALTNAQKAAEIDKNNIWYQLLLADLFKLNNRLKESTKVMEGIVNRNPENIDYYYDWANAYITEANLDGAIKVYDIIEKKIGVSEGVSLQKEKIYLNQNKFNKAVDEIEKLSAQFPEMTKYNAMIAELYMSKKMYDKALVNYNKILTKNPNEPFIHISLASYYREVGDKAKSYQELKLGFANPALDIDTKVQILLSYYSITEIYASLKNQAFELSEILIKTHKNDAKAYSIYGDFLYRDKKYKEAKDVFKKVIEIDSTKYPVWETLLIIESELANTKDLAEESARAIELFPEQPLIYLFSGISNFELNKLDVAIKSLSKGREFVVDNDKLLVQFDTYLGDIYYKNKEYSKSFEAFKRVLKLDSDNVYVMNNYSYYLSLQNQDLDEAESLGKKMNIIVPNNSSYQDTYGWVLYKLGRFDDAKVWINKAIESGGKANDVIMEHYGDVLYKLGDKENALQYWMKAKEAGKGSEFLDKKVADKKLYE